MNKNQNTLFQKIINENRFEADDYDSSLAQYSGWLRAILIIGSIIICSLFFIIRLEPKLYETPYSSIEVGYVWQAPTLRADITFPVNKSENELEAERRNAIQNTLLVFKFDSTSEQSAFLQLDLILDALEETEGHSNIIAGIQFSDMVIKPYREMSNSQKDSERNKIKREISNFLRNIYRNGYVNLTLSRIEKDEISVRINPIENIILPKTELVDQVLFMQKSDTFVKNRISELLRPLVTDILSKIAFPNLLYDKDLSTREQELAAMNVPKTIGTVRDGDIIIEKGEKVTQELHAKIRSYQSSRYLTEDNILSVNFIIGRFGHTALIFSILILYLFLLRPGLYFDNWQLSIICGIIIFSALLSWLSTEIQSGFPIEFLVLIPAFSMLSAIVFDSRTGFYITITMALLLAGIRGNDYTSGVTMIFAGTLAAYTVKDVKNRAQMFQSMFYIFIGLIIPILIFALERSTELYIILQRCLFAGINASISPLLTFGLLYIIERTSNISTDLRIKEFDNLNHPLLIKLSELAPGTYQHSLGVAMLSERCAQQLGANTLLVKVGSYFHDIGKMSKPEYFAENQIGIDNKHNLLPPKKSAAIIKAHVTDGIELAKQYNLPTRLIDFIETHHGTTLIAHFYAQALEESQNKEVFESDFRYPGPKPKSKEEAIVMICDSAEAIARIVAKTDNEIESILEKTIESKILDGQFDYADISVAEIRKIKNIIMKNIKGISHKRVAYKEIPKDSINQ